jgi:hypothetical protein
MDGHTVHNRPMFILFIHRLYEKAVHYYNFYQYPSLLCCPVFVPQMTGEPFDPGAVTLN